jgi:Fe-S cluster biosynthesis and repair protein YggX
MDQEQELRVQTYRFTFSNEFTEELTRFAKVHQYDERKQFKEAWQTWIKEETINPLINEEAKRLRNTGFDGDVLVKMFKSARYYFRNKSENKDPSAPSDKKERKQYESIPKERMEKIDAHIYNQLNKHIRHEINLEQTKGQRIAMISPGESFEYYLIENKMHIITELKEQSQNLITKKDCEEAIKKYKKTYKNRFYNIRQAIKKH